MSLETRLGVLESIPETPAVLVDLPALRRNVDRMAAAARDAGVALRPHAKTHKVPQVAQMQLEAGAVGLLVATLREAEVFVGAGARDLLVGYPIVGTVGVRRLVALADRTRLSISLDSLAVAEPIARAASAAGVPIALRLELDTGLRRVGVEPNGEAEELALRLADLPGTTFEGVMTHEGQILGQSHDRAELERHTATMAASMVAFAERLRSRGLACPIVSVGCTATALPGMRAPGITEVRPGTYVFNDATQVAHGAAPDDVAALVAATVISRPAADRAVIDAGSKTLSSDRLGVPDAPVVFGALVGRSGHVLVRLTEEHGVLRLPETSDLRVGDRVAVMPNHICAVVNLADELVVVDGARVVDRWPVAARGHG